MKEEREASELQDWAGSREDNIRHVFPLGSLAWVWGPTIFSSRRIEISARHCQILRDNVELVVFKYYRGVETIGNS